MSEDGIGRFLYGAHDPRFQMLYVFLVLTHERRRVVHRKVTAHPTEEWDRAAVAEAFAFEQIPRHLLRDRDKIFGDQFGRQVRDMDIEEVLSAPRFAVAAGLCRAVNRLDSAGMPGSRRLVCAESRRRISRDPSSPVAGRKTRRNHWKRNRRSWVE